MISNSGTIEGGVHRFAMRIYYEDTDAAGIVYYANYLKFAERARTEMVRLLGGGARLTADGGAGFAVRRCAVDYLLPARLDDEVEVRTRVVEVGGATVDLEQNVWRDADELARLNVGLAFMTPAGRPRRLPAAMRDAMKSINDLSTKG